MNVIIREADIDDADELARLASVTFPLACPPGAGPEDIQRFIAANLDPVSFRRYIADPQRAVLCADAGSGLWAYSLLVCLPSSNPQVLAALTLSPSVELSKFYVHPEHHGRGLAANLMAACLDRAAASGAAGIWLGVNQENVRAQRFYTKCGFVRVGTKTFRLGQRIENDYVMEQSLADRAALPG